MYQLGLEIEQKELLDLKLRNYDETYTRDKILWDSFIKQAKARGHTVLCVTARCEMYGDGVEVKEDLEHLVDGIYFTCGAPSWRVNIHD